MKLRLTHTLAISAAVASVLLADAAAQQPAAFDLGSGESSAGVRTLTGLLIGVMAVLWVAWTVRGAFREVAQGQFGVGDWLIVGMRSSAVLAFVLWFVR